MVTSHVDHIPSSLPGLVKVHGVHIKAGGAMLRLRLFQALSLLKPAAYEGVCVCVCAVLLTYLESIKFY